MKVRTPVGQELVLVLVEKIPPSAAADHVTESFLAVFRDWNVAAAAAVAGHALAGENANTRNFLTTIAAFILPVHDKIAV